jgi:hypothetical protein
VAWREVALSCAWKCAAARICAQIDSEGNFLDVSNFALSSGARSFACGCPHSQSHHDHRGLKKEAVEAKA